MVALFLVVFLFLLVAIEVVINAVDRVTYHMLTEEQRKQLEEAQSVSFPYPFDWPISLFVIP